MGIEDDKAYIKALNLTTWNVDFVNSGGDSTAPVSPDLEDRERVPFGQANAYSSTRYWASGSGSETHHAVLLDLDGGRFRLIPSSTPDHYHMVFDTFVEWDDYCALLDALVKVGIIEPGFAELTKARGQAFLRMPGVPKESSGRIVEFEEPPVDADTDSVDLPWDFCTETELALAEEERDGR